MNARRPLSAALQIPLPANGVPDEQGVCEPDEVVWLRDLDGTGSMHVCTPHCPGAVEYVRADLV